MIQNEAKSSCVWQFFWKGGANHLFLVENRGLRLGGADSHPSCASHLAVNCPKTWLDEANVTTSSFGRFCASLSLSYLLCHCEDELHHLGWDVLYGKQTSGFTSKVFSTTLPTKQCSYHLYPGSHYLLTHLVGYWRTTAQTVDKIVDNSIFKTLSKSQ